ncbi:MAG: hypothetical protein BKP49_01725 [Treponema sp. CETP13]|nr:MAG: hypothetical protein BKP49_01725 [Treponema sp. CETP13]
MSDIKDLREGGIVAGILIVIFLLLFSLSFPVSAEKKEGLAVAIQNVFDSENDDNLKVGEFIPINSPLQTSLSVYTVLGQQEDMYACIIRITGICGPVPVVFIYSALQGAKYFGIAGEFNKVTDYDLAGISYTQINYWSKKIPTIIEGSLNE